MTVSIRPGRYVAAVLQRPNGATRQGPWRPEGSFPIWWFDHIDERVAYLIRAILPERPEKPQ
jgi:hypothetical protein